MDKIKQLRIIILLSLLLSVVGIVSSMFATSYDNMATDTYQEYLYTNDQTPKGQELWEEFQEQSSTASDYYLFSGLAMYGGILFTVIALAVSFSIKKV